MNTPDLVTAIKDGPEGETNELLHNCRVVLHDLEAPALIPLAPFRPDASGGLVDGTVVGKVVEAIMLCPLGQQLPSRVRARKAGLGRQPHDRSLTLDRRHRRPSLGGRRWRTWIAVCGAAISMCSVPAFTSAAVADPVGSEPTGWSGAVAISPASVSTLAGSGSPGLQNGSSASFTAPEGLSIAGGFAYTIDSGYVRKIELATGAVSTVAGNGTVNGSCVDSTTPAGAQLSMSPLFAATLTNDGNYLYWSDPCNNNDEWLRRMSLANGAVSTIPGNLLDLGNTIGPGGRLYVMSGYDSISSVDPDTGTETALATLPNQSINNFATAETVTGMGADNTSLWISGFAQAGYGAPTYGVVSKVDTTSGTVTTKYLQPDLSVAGMYGTLVGTSSYVYVSTPTGRVWRFAKSDGTPASIAGASPGFLEGVGSQAWFGTTAGIDTDGTNLYVVDTSNLRIRKLVASAPLVAQQPSGWSATLNAGLGTASTAAGSGTAGLQDGTGSSASFGSPVGLSISGGYAYTVDSGYVRRITLATGAVHTMAGTGVTTGSCGDSAIPSQARLNVGTAYSGTLTNDGTYLYWSDTCGGNQEWVRRMSLSTGAVSLASQTVDLAQTVGPDGQLFTSSNPYGAISKVDPTTGNHAIFANLPARPIGNSTYAQNVTGMAADSTNLWTVASVQAGYGNYAYGVISKIDISTGAVTTVYQQADPNVVAPYGTVVSTAGYLYIGTSGGEVLRLNKSTSAIDVVLGSNVLGYADGQGSAAAFGAPLGIDTDGTDLWVADTANHVVRRIALSAGTANLPTQTLGTYPPSGIGSVEAPGAGNASERCGCGQGQATGNPVNTSTGVFWHTFEDLSVPGRGAALHVTRNYTSSSAQTNSIFGYGWSSNYGMYLTIDPSTNDISVHQEDGSQIAFVPGGNGHYSPIQPRILASFTANSDGSYTLTRNKRILYTFDNAGRLISVKDLNGNKTTLAYDGSGNLHTVTDSAGRIFTFTFTGSHVTNVSDQAGRSYIYGYSAAGDLTSVTDPTNAVWTFTYDSSHRLVTMLDPNQQSLPSAQQHPLTNAYDTQGRVSTQTDFAGRVTTFDYTSIAGATKVTDPAGHVTVDYYTNGLRSKSTTGYGTSAAASVSYTYDTATEAIASVTDPLNHVTSYTYDATGNTLTTTDPLNRTTTNTYDSLNDLLTSTDPAGTTTTRTYDSSGNLLTVSTPLKNSSGTVVATQKTTYHRDDATHPDDITSIVSPNGNTTTYIHDSAGNLTAVTAPPTPENSAGNKTTYTYDPNTSWRLSVTTPRGNLTGATAANFTTSYAYDNDGRPTRIRDGLWSASSPTQHQVTMVYDLDGNLTSGTDGNGSSTGHVYDADNELTTTNLPTGAATHKSWTPDGMLATSTDGAGHVTTNGYDPQNRLTSVTDPLNHTTTYSYDAAGNLTLRAAHGATCTGSTPSAGCAKYVYDAANELTARTYLDSGTPAVTAINYDADGRRTKETDPSGTSTTTYDNLGRVTAYQNGYGTTTSYTYDLDDNTLSVTYPGSGHTVTHTFDALDRPATTKDWLSNTVTFGYDANSNPVTTAFPAGSGETDTTTYSSIDTLTGIADTRTVSGTTTTLAAFAYTRDGANQLKTSTTTGISEAAQNYSHDNLGRLTASGSSSTPTSHTYSTSDDPTSRGTTSGGSASTQAFNAGDQLCWSTTTTVASPTCGTVPSGATTYTYDTNGNRLTRKVGSAAASTYAYNEAQQLTKYTTSAGTATTYTYDGDGLRQTKTTGGTTTRFTWDTTTGNAQLLSDGTNYYLYDDTGSPLEQINVSSGTVTWLHHDQYGSTRLMTNTSGTNVGTANYDPYGTKTASTGTVTTPLGYNGQYTDTESGLIYLRARYYDPATAQFLTPDPLRATTGEPYAYTHDNPTDRSDPSGLCDGFWKCAYSGLEGFANGVTFGGAGALDEALSPGSTCTYDHGAIYTAGYFAGQVFDAIATDGGTTEIEATEGAAAAAETAGSDWPELSGVLRDAAKGKGNFGLGAGTQEQATAAGDAWVGSNATLAGDGKTLVSQDGLRQFRPPSYKPNLDQWQANFESRVVPRGPWQGNGHLDITDPP